MRCYFKKKLEQIFIFYKAKSTSTSGVETHPVRAVMSHLTRVSKLIQVMHNEQDGSVQKKKNPIY